MAEYSVTRSTRIAAPPERIQPLIASFRQWRQWSPFEDQDPDLVREYRGPESGTGAVYEYRGSARAGSGIMTITYAAPERVDVELEFLRPFKAVSHHTFALTPVDGGSTEVSWTMRGTQNAIMRALMNMERFAGPQFERGLAALQRVAEDDRDPGGSRADC